MGQKNKRNRKVDTYMHTYMHAYIRTYMYIWLQIPRLISLHRLGCRRCGSLLWEGLGANADPGSYAAVASFVRICHMHIEIYVCTHRETERETDKQRETETEREGWLHVFLGLA